MLQRTVEECVAGIVQKIGSGVCSRPLTCASEPLVNIHSELVFILPVQPGNSQYFCRLLKLKSEWKGAVANYILETALMY